MDSDLNCGGASTPYVCGASGRSANKKKKPHHRSRADKSKQEPTTPPDAAAIKAACNTRHAEARHAHTGYRNTDPSYTDAHSDRKYEPAYARTNRLESAHTSPGQRASVSSPLTHSY